MVVLLGPRVRFFYLDVSFRLSITSSLHSLTQCRQCWNSRSPGFSGLPNAHLTLLPLNAMADSRLPLSVLSQTTIKMLLHFLPPFSKHRRDNSLQSTKPITNMRAHSISLLIASLTAQALSTAPSPSTRSTTTLTRTVYVSRCSTTSTTTTTTTPESTYTQNNAPTTTIPKLE